MSRADELTEHFYEWERWGRGWYIADAPVSIEPTFYPFFNHAPLNPPIDDGRSQTFFSRIFENVLACFHMDTPESALSGSIQKTFPAPKQKQLPAPSVPLPLFAEPQNALHEFQISLPPDLHISKDAFQQFLQSVAHCGHPVAFEVIGSKDSIGIQLAVEQYDVSLIKQQFGAHFPDAILIPQNGSLGTKWNGGGAALAVVEFGLSREFMIPMQCHPNFGNDPLVAVVGALSDLEKDEVGVLQVLWKHSRNPWAESILRSVTTSTGEPFFANAPELVIHARQKVSKSLYGAVVRIAARTTSDDRLIRVMRDLAGSLTQFTNPIGNELIPLRNDGYGSAEHEQDLLLRQSHRLGMLLNADELSSLAHLPAPAVREKKLVRAVKKTKEAPDLALNHKLILGLNVHAGEKRTVTLSPSQRRRHMHVVGASGTGKSTFLLNLIIQDINAGEGLAVFDPHGDLIEAVLGHIPESRLEDVILLDPSDEQFPISFNILSANSAIEKNLLASDLVSIFQRFSSTWGDQMTSVLGNAVLAFLESREGGTLADLRRFLVEGSFRSLFLETVNDPEVIYYWKKEFPLLSGRPQASILTRLDAFLRPKPIRNMVSQKENRLDIEEIMNGRKIFLVKLAQGLIGVENSFLLGSLLVSKFHQLALGRQAVHESERESFWLYIDEFHNFVTPSMAGILSGARKYGVGLVLAHQELHQLQSRDPDVLSALLANAYARICFRLGDSDAKKLSEGFATFDARDLQSLGTGEAICRIERSAFDFNLETYPPLALPDDDVEERKQRIVEKCRAKYASPIAEVEALMETARQTPTNEPSKVTEKGEALTSRQAASKSGIRAGKALSVSGKGGSVHKLIQQMLKQGGENLGFRATVEKQINGSLDGVDVCLEKGSLSIACEIAITSKTEYEMGNLEKCLGAGYGYVLMIAHEPERLPGLQETARRAFGDAVLKNVRFVTPHEALSFIQELENSDDGTGSSARGYRVKVNLRPREGREHTERTQAVNDILTEAVRRFKKP